MAEKGFGQIHNVDFSETFAPTPSSASVNISVAVANEKGWLLRHLDLKQFFLRRTWMKLYRRGFPPVTGT